MALGGDQDGQLLRSAAKANDLEMVKASCEGGAALGVEGGQLLSTAVEANNLEMVQFFCEGGAQAERAHDHFLPELKIG